VSLHKEQQLLLVANHRAANNQNFQQSALDSLCAYLDSTACIALATVADLPEDLGPYRAVILTDASGLSADHQGSLANFVQAGGGAMALTGCNEQPLPEFFGVTPSKIGPRNELRVLFTDHDSPLRNRLPVVSYLQGRYHYLELKADSTETILYADWRYGHSAVLTRNRVGEGNAVATTLQDLANPWLQQVLYRILLDLTGRREAELTLGVGLLGYSPAVGLLHGTGTAETTGLDLRAICDLSPQRIAEARQDFPNATIHEAADSLCADSEIDLVVIATPPSSHAKLAVDLLNAGKHVVCEKPLALTIAETAAMLEAAEHNNRFIGCHQNRRWDVDYMAIKEAVNQQRIGNLFYAETFVGSFNHPCAYWHSHDKISGGTTYDWGAHYLDWMLSLISEKVTGVICTRQNRVWHDVTNADQERIQLRFAGGQEADFIHSDIAAARKPKWYMLGTEGAIVGDWRDITTYNVNSLRYFDENEIPATEMPPALRLYRHLQPDGEETNRSAAEEMVLPQRPVNGFHHNLTDHLLTGEPIEVAPEHSARVVAILETAVRSAEQGGTLEAVEI